MVYPHGGPEQRDSLSFDPWVQYLARAVRVPVLPIHGEDDDIVPISQSVATEKALKKAGQGTELLRIPEEGHSRWSADNDRLALIAIDRFLWAHPGPGHGTTAAPPPLPTRK